MIAPLCLLVRLVSFVDVFVCVGGSPCACLPTQHTTGRRE